MACLSARRERTEKCASATGGRQRQVVDDLGHRAKLGVAVGVTRPSSRRKAWPPSRRRARSAVNPAHATAGSGHRLPRRRSDRCLRPRSVVTSSVAIAVPRRATVKVWTPGRTVPVSAITLPSVWKNSGRDNRRRCFRRRNLTGDRWWGIGPLQSLDMLGPGVWEQLRHRRVRLHELGRDRERSGGGEIDGIASSSSRS